jgi:hypothetical protein
MEIESSVATVAENRPVYSSCRQSKHRREGERLQIQASLQHRPSSFLPSSGPLPQPSQDTWRIEVRSCHNSGTLLLPELDFELPCLGDPGGCPWIGDRATL